MNGIRSDLNFDNERLFYLALLLAVTPLWLAHYLPGVDLPGHVAQAVALQEIWRGNPLFTDLFELNLLTPYLTGTVLLALLSYIVPADVAVKFIMSGVVVATPILAGRLLDAIGGDSKWRWLVIPSTYSFAFYWGFFPFVTAVPFGLVLLLLTVRLNQRPSASLGVLIAIYSIFLFFSHLLVLSFSSLLALAWLAGCNYRRPKTLAVLCLPYTAPLPMMFAWLYQALNSGTYIADDQILFGSILKRLLDIIVQSSGLDGTFFGVSAFVFVIIIALPFASRMKLTKRPEKWLMALCGFVTFMLFPTHGMGISYLFDRFGLYLPILWFVLWERTPAETTRWHWIGIFAVFIWAGANMLRFSAFNIETRGFDKIMAEMESGKHTLSIMAMQNSSQFNTRMLRHLPSWYQAKLHGIVDFNFGMFHTSVVRFKPEKRPAITDTLSWNPSHFEWQKYHSDKYDYFIIRSRTDASAGIFKDHRSSVELVSNDDWWWLYKRIDTGSR